MGMLAPLYLAGLAALSLPLIFHLVRRTPRGRQEFSSLMFLTPSPPRLTRRSRLDQILLLLMRLAALSLLAFAFARPFLREAATLALEDLPTRRVAIAVDTSASMRRGDLWQQAVRQVEKEISDLGPHDEVALFTFDDRLQTEVGFNSVEAGSSASQADVVRQSLKKLRPGWGATDLGTALTAIASELAAANDVKQLAAEPQIILISDFQKGAKIEALQAFEWPERVRAILRPLSPKGTTNAFASLLISEEDAPEAGLRVRVASTADSAGDQFFVSWSKEGAKASTEGDTAVYVPPGQSRVVKLPRPESNLQADRIILRGDDHEFDNTYFVVPPRKQEVKLLYIGSDAADDPQGLQYYLRLATSGDPLRQVEVLAQESDDASRLTGENPPQLCVVTRTVSSGLLSALRLYAERGGTLLVVPKDREAVATLTALVDDVQLGDEKPGINQYLLLGEIDFAHPLFVPFASPRYNDFTKIHFWKHRSLTLKSPAATRVVAKFDNGDPALLDRSSGKGRIYVLASGWNPDDSQLALSSKFVPLIGALLDQACGAGQTLAGVAVGQSVSLPANRRESLIVHKPGGGEAKVPAEATSFSQTDEPGIYNAGTGAEEVRFAVNLAAAESNTTPMALEQLEQLGLRLGQNLTRAERLNQIRQQRDTELEGRQKIWRWLIVGALGVLVLETWWAGRASRQIAQQMELAT
jgi:Aerotolerance regulator N-terminal/von Willebrand factor type A domain